MKIIASYSNKGGVGKTAAAVNIAHALANAGRRVLLCDLDPQGASGYYFRVKPSKKLIDGAFFEDVARFTKAIRASDYEGLDILPANETFRDFDVFLSRMRKSDSRLKKALQAVDGDYDVILLDCPPNISILSENVFRAADALLVPVIPTTLSQRTFDQLVEFFRAHDLPPKKLHAFFSMAQGTKAMHATVMEDMRAEHPKRMMETVIPSASEVERMGLTRQPVAVSAPRSAAARAYVALHDELVARIGPI